MSEKYKDAADAVNMYLWRIGGAMALPLLFYGFAALTSLGQKEGTAVMLAGLMVNMPQCGAVDRYIQEMHDA